MVAVEAAKEMRYLLGLEENIIPIETVDEPDDINDEDTKKNYGDKKRARNKSEEYAGTSYQSS